MNNKQRAAHITGSRDGTDNDRYVAIDKDQLERSGQYFRLAYTKGRVATRLSSRTAASSLLFGLCMGTVAPVFADRLVLEEVIVTAQKRESNLQDTPVAITAMTSEQLELNRIENVSDLALSIPSMTYTEQSGFSQAALRGVSTDLTGLSQESALAMYVDGVYRGASFSQTVPQFDLERVEVLRGPQGTLYGRNATAGAVNVITKMPTEALEIHGALTGGNYNRIRGEFGISGPLTDGIAGRLSVLSDSHDGYAENKARNTKEGDSDLEALNASFSFNVGENTELVLRGDYSDLEHSLGSPIGRQMAPGATGITPENLGGFMTESNPDLGGLSLADVFGLSFPTPGSAFVQDPDDQEFYGDSLAKTAAKRHGYSATLSHQFDEVTAKLILAHQESDLFVANDADGTDVTMLRQVEGVVENRQTTAEINISGSAWNDRATWVTGGYYFQDDGDAHFYYDASGLQTTFEALFGITGPAGAPLPPGSLALPPFDQRQLENGKTSVTPFINFRGAQESESWAVFGQTTVDVTERLHLTLGGRYTEDTKKMHREGRLNIGGAACDNRIERDWSSTTGTGILAYDIGDNAMTYFSVSKGFKAGGFNVGECEGAFDPEAIWSYEFGVKSKLLDNRLQLNAATFFYDWEDIQVNRFVQATSSITNAAEAELYGAELEFVALVSGGLMFDGGVTYLHSEYAGGASFSDPMAGGEPVSVDGNQLMRAPEWKAYLGAQYAWETDIGYFTLRGDVTYSDSYYFDVFEASLPNQDEMEADSYTITNAHLRWQSNSGKYAGQLFVQNIGDEMYATTAAANGTIGGVLKAYSFPRQYGLRVEMNF